MKATETCVPTFALKFELRGGRIEFLAGRLEEVAGMLEK